MSSKKRKIRTINMDSTFIKFKFLQRLKTPTRSSTSDTRSADDIVSLPKLNFRIFSGGYMEWKSFFNWFKEL